MTKAFGPKKPTQETKLADLVKSNLNLYIYLEGGLTSEMENPF